MQLNRVVFPAPLGPMTEKISPFFMAKPMSWRALIPPKEIDRCSISKKEVDSMLFHFYPVGEYFCFSIGQGLDQKTGIGPLAAVNIVFIIGFKIDFRPQGLKPFEAFHLGHEFL